MINTLSITAKSITTKTKQSGFTLVEVMIVVAIIGILAAIAYPSYNNYILKTNRTDMMAELQNIAGRIEAQKLASGSYANMTWPNVNSNRAQYPYTGAALYNITAPGLSTGNWVLTATPTGQMAGDGNLTLDFRGEKCHVISETNKRCSIDDGWR